MFELALHNFEDRDMSTLFVHLSTILAPTVIVSDPSQHFSLKFDLRPRSMSIFVAFALPANHLTRVDLSYPALRVNVAGKYYSSYELRAAGDSLSAPSSFEDNILAASMKWILPTAHVSGEEQPLYAKIMYSALIALDPTGTFFRFTKTLQILSKLYFININYGKKQSDFLWLIHHTPEPKEAPHLDVYDSEVTRGKLTQKSVALDFISTLSWQVYVYLSSSIIALLLSLRLPLPACMLHLVYYLDRVHLIIFNLVFIDFPENTDAPE